jgi:DNA-binding response OmpR family regulator
MPLAAYLRECGFKVVEATDSDEAMTVLQRAEVTVDAMFADAELPGSLDAFGLSQWVRQNYSSVKIILAGSPDKAAAKAGDLCENGPHMTKPYHPQTLEKRIRELLAARERTR